MDMVYFVVILFIIIIIIFVVVINIIGNRFSELLDLLLSQLYPYLIPAEVRRSPGRVISPNLVIFHELFFVHVQAIFSQLLGKFLAMGLVVFFAVMATVSHDSPHRRRDLLDRDIRVGRLRDLGHVVHRGGEDELHDPFILFPGDGGRHRDLLRFLVLRCTHHAYVSGQSHERTPAALRLGRRGTHRGFDCKP